MNESELADRCSKGDNLARKELYELFAGKMLSLCVRYTNNVEVAHDLLHDGFIKVFSAITTFTFQGEGSLQAWLSRIFINKALEYLRKKNLLSMAIPLDQINELPNEQEPDLENLSLDILMGFVLELPPGYRTVFNLYVFEEWSHKEIAAKLHINEKSSASQYYRARKLLMKRIDEYLRNNK